MEKLNDVIARRKEEKSYGYYFTLFKRNWEEYELNESFNWTTYSFTQENRVEIPNKPGIYSLVINPIVADHPQRYLCYIGRSEDLRTRYGQYLSEAQRASGRPEIVDLLNLWEGNIEFSFTLIDKSKLKVVEDCLIRTFKPPCNDKVPARISKPIKGAFDES